MASVTVSSKSKKSPVVASAYSGRTPLEIQMYGKLRGELTKLEKRNHLGNHGFSSNFQNRMSTNLLVLDLILGGGIIPGYWYTAFGPEQSAKSTLSIQVMIAALLADVPIVHSWDYEGTSGDADYLLGIMKTNGLKIPTDQLYGVRDKRGGYAIPPRVDYYPEDVLETFFNVESSFLRRMPDKFMFNGQWWYGFDNDKHGKEMTQGKHDKRMFTETGKLCVPAMDGRMQALFILDSYGAMNPNAADDDDPSKGMALAARAFSENIKRVLGKLRKKRVSIMGVNQLRLKPAVMYGSPEYEVGGEALKFASACRVKMTPRVIPWSGAKGMYEEEDSIDGGTDTYRYIHARTHKNKLASANQEGWFRIWTEDSKKQGRGFDPVYDLYNYLVMTGQVSGPRKKLQIKLPRFEKSKPLSWLDLKALTLGGKEESTEVLRKAGVIKKGEAPFNIRKLVQKQMDAGVGMDLYVKAKQAKSASRDSDEE